MVKRRDLDREGLEVYLLYLILGYRPIFRLASLLFLVYAVVVFGYSPLVGSVALGLAIFLVLLTTSFPLAHWVAKLGAWAGTIRKGK